MYILIDRENMRIPHLHENVDCLADLAHIECHDINYCIVPIDNAAELRHFTDYELKLLYRTITNSDVEEFNFTRQQCMQILFDAIWRLPVSVVNKFESDRQAQFIDSADPERKSKWTYVHGATRPARQAALFELPTRLTFRSEENERTAKAGQLPALGTLIPTSTHSLQRAQPAKAPTGTNPAVSIGPGPQPAHSEPASQAKAPKAPRRGTMKELVYKVADELWEKEGSPKEKGEILKLRKRIMDILETDHGIKRGNSSNTLAGWHKERAPY